MKTEELKNLNGFRLINEGSHLNDEISTPFCCDLLSVAMNHASEGCAWVTVMANMNTLAVASLTDCACVILACGSMFDEASLAKATEQGITVFATDLEIFEAAMEVYKLLNA